MYVPYYQITYLSVLLEHEHPKDKHYTESFLKPFTVPANIYCVIPEHLLGPSFFCLHEHPQFCHERVKTQHPSQDPNEHNSPPPLPYSLMNIQHLPYPAGFLPSMPKVLYSDK